MISVSLRRGDATCTRTLKTASRQPEIHIKDILILGVWDDKPKAESKELKGNDNTEVKHVEACNIWNLEKCH